MSIDSFSPIELVPFEQIPEIRSFEDRHLDDFSDIFPLSKVENLHGILGDYRGGDPSSDSPLWHVMQGVRAYRSQFYKRQGENHWVGTDETNRGLASTTLQTHLIACVNTGYQNLLAKNVETMTAANLVDFYVGAKSTTELAAYNSSLTDIVVDQAAEQRHEELPEPPKLIPVLTMEDGEPVTRLANLDREERMALRSDEMKEIRFRIKRLHFERLSALAIVKLLKQDIQKSTS